MRTGIACDSWQPAQYKPRVIYTVQEKGNWVEFSSLRSDQLIRKPEGNSLAPVFLKDSEYLVDRDCGKKEHLLDIVGS